MRIINLKGTVVTLAILLGSSVASDTLNQSSFSDLKLDLIRKAFFNALLVPNSDILQDFQPIASIELVFQPADYAPLTVKFPGQQVPRILTTEAPKVFLRVTDPTKKAFSQSSRFTFVIIDPDALTRSTTGDMLYREMLATDISLIQTNEPQKFSLNFTNRPLITEYLPLNPSLRTGFHRYTCFLLKGQPSPSSIENFIKDPFMRFKFNLTEFINSSGLDKPIAGTFFLTQNSQDEPLQA